MKIAQYKTQFILQCAFTAELYHRQQPTPARLLFVMQVQIPEREQPDILPSPASLQQELMPLHWLRTSG